jgi:hypothetical protein
VRFQRVPLLQHHNIDTLCPAGRTCLTLCYWSSSDATRHASHRFSLPWQRDTWREPVGKAYADAGSSLSSDLARLRVLAAQHTRSSWAPRVVWTACDDQPAFCRRLGCHDDDNEQTRVVAWQRGSSSNDDDDGTTKFVASSVDQAALLWAQLRVRRGELSTAATALKMHVRSDRGASLTLVEHVVWSTMLRRRARVVYALGIYYYHQTMCDC